MLSIFLAIQHGQCSFAKIKIPFSDTKNTDWMRSDAFCLKMWLSCKSVNGARTIEMVFLKSSSITHLFYVCLSVHGYSAVNLVFFHRSNVKTLPHAMSSTKRRYQHLIKKKKWKSIRIHQVRKVTWEWELFFTPARALSVFTSRLTFLLHILISLSLASWS